MKKLYAVFLLVVAVYFLFSPTKPAASRARLAAEADPAEAVSGGPDAQVVH